MCRDVDRTWLVSLTNAVHAILLRRTKFTVAMLMNVLLEHLHVLFYDYQDANYDYWVDDVIM